VALLTTHGYKFLALDRSQFRLIPARPSDREGYANYFAVHNVAWLQRRFAGAGPAARRVAADLVARGTQVVAHRRRLLASLAEQAAYIESLRTEQRRVEETLLQTQTAAQRSGAELQAHIDALTAKLSQHAADSRQQDQYIGALQQERDRFAREGEQVRLDLDRHLGESQRHLADLRAQVDQLAATSGQQEKFVAVLQGERDRLAGEAAQARAQVDQLAATSRQQNDYIATLKSEADRLEKSAAQLTESCAHYVKVIDEQTAYIRLLEQQRQSGAAQPGA
jgi:chromosome segregation ATPase